MGHPPLCPTFSAHPDIFVITFLTTSPSVHGYAQNQYLFSVCVVLFVNKSIYPSNGFAMSDEVFEDAVGDTPVDETTPVTTQTTKAKKNKKKKKNSGKSTSDPLTEAATPDDNLEAGQEDDGDTQSDAKANGTDADEPDTPADVGAKEVLLDANPEDVTEPLSLRPELPLRQGIEECLKLGEVTAGDTAALEAVAHSYNKHSQNYLLQAKYNQLHQTYQSKDAKLREQINLGTENIKKTFDNIKQTVGGFSEMFEKKIDWEFWTRIVNNYEEVITNELDQLNALILQGIPREFRGIIWQLVARLKNFQMEEFYLQVKLEPSIHEKSIKRDLTRTLFYTNVEQVNKGTELYNVIKAYLLFDPDVGYTQGMIFVAVPLIMNMLEAECFCLLVTLMKEYRVRDMFCPEMKGLHLMLYEFDRLVEVYLPLLYNHLAKQGIKLLMYASQWFLTFFAYKFPLDMVLRIYDIIITQGTELILKLAVNLMIKNESHLLQLKFDKLLEYLKDKMFNVYVNDDYVRQHGEEGPSSKRLSTISKRFSLLSKRGSDMQGLSLTNPYYKLDAMMQDAMTINVDPVELSKYEAEFDRIYLTEEAKAGDIEKLRVENGKLRHTIKELETEYLNFNRDHVDTVQHMVDTKVTLPEVRNDIEDLQHQIELLKVQIDELKQKTTPDLSLDELSEARTPEGEALPELLQNNISELLTINAKETERFAELDDELAVLLNEDAELSTELRQKGRQSWFGFGKK